MPCWIDPENVLRDKENYMLCRPRLFDVLENWQQSVYAYEFFLPDGSLKPVAEMPERHQEAFKSLMQSLQSDAPVQRPLIGIGIYDHVEFGSGLTVALSCALHKVDILECYCRSKQYEDLCALGFSL